MRKQLEKDIEADVIAYAESRGWWQSKYVAPGLAGVPDRIFIRRGTVLFVELKRPKKEPTTQQDKRHRDMRKYGARVHWITSLEEAHELLF